MRRGLGPRLGSSRWSGSSNSFRPTRSSRPPKESRRFRSSRSFCRTLLTVIVRSQVRNAPTRPLCRNWGRFATTELRTVCKMSSTSGLRQLVPPQPCPDQRGVKIDHPSSRRPNRSDRQVAPEGLRRSEASKSILEIDGVVAGVNCEVRSLVTRHTVIQNTRQGAGIDRGEAESRAPGVTTS